MRKVVLFIFSLSFVFFIIDGIYAQNAGEAEEIEAHIQEYLKRHRSQKAVGYSLLGAGVSALTVNMALPYDSRILALGWGGLLSTVVSFPAILSSSAIKNKADQLFFYQKIKDAEYIIKRNNFKIVDL